MKKNIFVASTGGSQPSDIGETSERFSIFFFKVFFLEKFFLQKKTLKNDFEIVPRSHQCLTIGTPPPLGGHKNDFFQFLKTPLDSISGALSKVIESFFSNSPLDRTFHQKTRLLSASQRTSRLLRRRSVLVSPIYIVES